MADGDARASARRSPERRRRLPGGRPHQHNVRLSAGEQKRIESAALEAGLTVPNLLAQTALAALAGEGRLSVAKQRALAIELTAVRRLMKAIGRNVDELAATTNTTGQTPPEVAPTMHAVATLVSRLDATLTRYEDPRG